MVIEQSPRVHAQGPRLHDSPHPGEEVLPVLSVPKDRRPFDPPNHNMV